MDIVKRAIEYHDLNFDLTIQKTILRTEGKKAIFYLNVYIK